VNRQLINTPIGEIERALVVSAGHKSSVAGGSARPINIPMRGIESIPESALKKPAGLESNLTTSSPHNVLVGSKIRPMERPPMISTYSSLTKRGAPRKAGAKSTRFKASSKSALQSTSLLEDFYEDFGFLWSIDALEAIYDDMHPPRILSIGSKNSNDIARIWFPPVAKEMFKRQNGNLYRWRVGGSEIVDNIPRPEKTVEVASVFFQPRQENFVAYSKDCTRYDIARDDYGWCQIGFHHHPGYMSEVDIAGESDVLAAPANGSSWMPQVLPEAYNYPIRNPAKSFTGKPGGLCGRLSLLIGMAAFSAKEEHAEAVVSQCFEFGKWNKHMFETGIGRT
jgi:hypothetical protein